MPGGYVDEDALFGGGGDDALFGGDGDEAFMIEDEGDGGFGVEDAMDAEADLVDDPISAAVEESGCRQAALLDLRNASAQTPPNFLRAWL